VGRGPTFLIASGLTLTILWSFAFPVVVNGATAFTSVWRGWASDVAPGWFVAELGLAFVFGVLACRILPDDDAEGD